ncbi:hypothetical protein GCM10022197_17270 [Microlunatus spumicola]|uniref:Uncharacterized protein n=1 Tax=Microlunatus spumicola TaxID=81499 RepID=A0ABP6X8S5_9ACTN
MNKTPDPGEVVRDKVIPAAEELVAAFAERVGPLAKEAVDQVTPVAQAAAEKTVALAHAAAEKVAPLTHQAVDAVTPFAQQTRDAVAPYAQQAADAVSPYASQAAERVAPLAQQAAGAVAPYATLLVEQGRKSGLDLADRLEPALGAARDAFDGARERVTSDVLPAVGAAATTAAASAAPLVAAATERGKALVQSTRSQPVVVAPPKKKRGWLTTLAVVAAAAGATYVVVRRLVGDKGSQWQAARPSTPYEPPVSAEAGVATPTPETAPPTAGGEEVVASTTSLYGTAGTGEGSQSPVEDTDASAVAARNETIDEVADVDEGADSAPAAGQTSGTYGEGSATDASTASSGTSGSSEGTFGDADGASPLGDDRVEEQVQVAEERVYEEPEAAVWAEEDTKMGGGPAEHPERYDLPGVYVGVEPPPGYTIKGNERSMKYHTVDSNSYGRTIAQVWFDSEDAAEKAGFTRAQH